MEQPAKSQSIEKFDRWNQPGLAAQVSPARLKASFRERSTCRLRGLYGILAHV